MDYAVRIFEFQHGSFDRRKQAGFHQKDENVLAGMLNLEKVIEIKTTKKFEDSSLAKILQMVQEASSRKAKTELFIRKFAKIYTPIVFFLAVALTFVPYLL